MGSGRRRKAVAPGIEYRRGQHSLRSVSGARTIAPSEALADRPAVGAVPDTPDAAGTVLGAGLPIIGISHIVPSP